MTFKAFRRFSQIHIMFIKLLCIHISRERVNINKINKIVTNVNGIAKYAYNKHVISITVSPKRYCSAFRHYQSGNVNNIQPSDTP